MGFLGPYGAVLVDEHYKSWTTCMHKQTMQVESVRVAAGEQVIRFTNGAESRVGKELQFLPAVSTGDRLSVEVAQREIDGDGVFCGLVYKSSEGFSYFSCGGMRHKMPFVATVGEQVVISLTSNPALAGVETPPSRSVRVLRSSRNKHG